MTSALTRDQGLSSGQLPSTGAEVLVKQLESYGVEVVFGLCGHTNIAVLDALSRSRIRFVTTRHEQGTAHMADGYARVTNWPTVCIAVNGVRISCMMNDRCSSRLCCSSNAFSLA